MKRRLLLIALSILSLGSVLYKSQYNQHFEENTVNVVALSNVENPNEKDNNNSKYMIMDSHVSLAKHYKNIEELKSDSSIIIEGVVKSTKSITLDHITYTHSQVELKDIFKTNDSTIKKGDTVCIKELGGILDKESLYKIYKDKFPDKEFDKDKFIPQNVTSNGIKVMEQGDHVIIFATLDPHNVKEKCYYVVGVYQGKYNVYNDMVEHQVPKEEEALFQNKVTNKKELVDLINKN